MNDNARTCIIFIAIYICSKDIKSEMYLKYVFRVRVFSILRVCSPVRLVVTEEK